MPVAGVARPAPHPRLSVGGWIADMKVCTDCQRERGDGVGRSVERRTALVVEGRAHEGEFHPPKSRGAAERRRALEEAGRRGGLDGVEGIGRVDRAIRALGGLALVVELRAGPGVLVVALDAGRTRRWTRTLPVGAQGLDVAVGRGGRFPLLSWVTKPSRDTTRGNVPETEPVARVEDQARRRESCTRLTTNWKLAPLPRRRWPIGLPRVRVDRPEQRACRRELVDGLPLYEAR